ncbi:undecaprenyl-phosphate glucose phosphotransferase, partial [bacterium]|nr:undecaprenyl-phosphate glucose phosphotransferase [bacterium]
FVLSILIIGVLIFILKATSFSRYHVFFTYLISFLLVIIFRYLLMILLKLYRKLGGNYRNVIIIGGGDVAKQLYKYFYTEKGLGNRLISVISNKLSFDLDKKVLNSEIDDLENLIQKNEIDEIYYTLSLNNTNQIKKLRNICDKYMIRFKLVPDFRAFLYKNVDINFLDDVPVITIRKEPLTDFANKTVKRIFDIIFSLFVILLFLSWMYPIIAILIKFSSKGPVLFRQLRTGKDNEDFICYKFRSMSINNDADLKQVSKGDVRVTRIGSFLRKTSLDEFPQFFNVLFGSMSIVGPRPHMLLHTKEYSELINKYMVRQLIKPGITGQSQVRGYRGETKELRQMEGRVRLDVWYIENWTLALDINIIFQTIFQVFSGDKNAY